MKNESLTLLNETEALHIVLCTNDETVGFSWGKDIAGCDYAMAATDAMRKAAPGIDVDPDTSSTFSDWNGGTYSKRNLGWGKCFISLRKNSESGEWNYFALDSEASPETQAVATRLADSANEAIQDAVAAYEE